MDYFTHCSTPDEARAEYRRLAKQHHPDLGGDTATMQAINIQYEALLKDFSGRTFARQNIVDDGPATWTYHYNATLEADLMAAIARVLKAVAYVDATVTLVGTWLWIVGETRPVKEDLKAAGCWWNGKRGAWNWHPPGHGTRFNDHVTLDDILAAGTRLHGKQGLTTA